MNQALTAIRSMMPGLQKQTALLQQSIIDFEGQEAALLKERDELLAQPLAADDLIALIQADIDASADRYRNRAVRVLHEVIARPQSTASRGSDSLTPKLTIHDAQKRSKAFHPEDSSMIGGFRELREIGLHGHVVDGGRGEPLHQVPATFLFRHEMKRAIAEIVSAMDYPFPQARPRAEVEQRLAEIERDLAEVRATRSELKAQAKALGLAL